jgi:hypothetical protein
LADLTFLTDEHIHKPIVNQLRERGVDIVRVEDLGWKGEADVPLLEYAAGEGRALVTGDDDFLAHHVTWQQAGRRHTGIFYVLPQVRQQRKAAVGIIFNELWFYWEAVRDGAASLEEDVYNQVIFITGR